mmetsp:Transcript_31789/g.68331  ORF Transcript_31789/g.68331 Transcript_31789/m.68331 type:complete len:232 (-) Transcript_31789:72-767(-)
MSRAWCASLRCAVVSSICGCPAPRSACRSSIAMSGMRWSCALPPQSTASTSSIATASSLPRQTDPKLSCSSRRAGVVTTRLTSPSRSWSPPMLPEIVAMLLPASCRATDSCCSASSRVGASMSVVGWRASPGVARAGGALSTRWSNGNSEMSVFPEPVCAHTSTSRPRIAGSSACVCTSFGALIFIFSTNAAESTGCISGCSCGNLHGCRAREHNARTQQEMDLILVSGVG